MKNMSSLHPKKKKEATKNLQNFLILKLKIIFYVPGKLGTAHYLIHSRLQEYLLLLNLCPMLRMQRQAYT